MKKIGFIGSVLFACLLFSFSLSASETKKKEKEEIVRYFLLEEIWKKGALLENNFTPANTPEALSGSLLQLHSRLYSKLKDPVLRMRHAQELKKSISRETFVLLVCLLEKEKDPFCRSALLSTLDFLAKKGCGDPSLVNRILPYGKDQNKESRKYASRLYFSLAKDPDPEKVLASMEGKNDEYIMRELFSYFVRFANKIPEERIAKWSGSTKTELQGRAMAFSLLKSENGSPENSQETILKKLKEDHPFMIRYYIAKGAAHQKELYPEIEAFLQKESKNGLLLVYLKEMGKRAGILTEKQERFLTGFLDRKYPSSLRLASVQALKNTKKPFSGNALVLLLKEEELSLRTEAAKALQKLNADASIRKKVAEMGKKYPFARLEAAEILTGIPNDRSSDDVLLQFLEEAGKKDPQSAREIMLQKKCIAFFGDVKSIKSMDTVSRKSSSKISAVREETAKTLGKIASAASFPVLKKLLKDKDPEVAGTAMDAVLYMALNKLHTQQDLKKHFSGETAYLLKKRPLEFAKARALAAKTASLLDLTGNCRKDLYTLAEKECITVPMSPKSFDADHVRISCLLALFEEAKKKKGKILKDFERCLDQLIAEANKKDSYATECWKEYLRQLDLLRRNKKILPGKVTPARINMIIAPMD